MNYYMLHASGIKKVDEKSYKAHKQYKDGTTKNRDIIDWYNDGENIFFGWAALDIFEVVHTIIQTINNFNADFVMCEAV